MNCQNPPLYNAIKSYVSAAIGVILKQVPIEAGGSDLDEETFFFARLQSQPELKELAEYKNCLEILKSDPVLKKELDVLAGPPGGIRSRTPTADGLMWRVLELGLPAGRSNFDPKYFEDQYAGLEEAYYSSDLVYQAIAPLHGLLITGSAQLADDLDISVLTTEELGPPNAPRRTSVTSDHWTERLCAVRARYFLPKVVGEDKPVTPEDWEKDRSKQLDVNDRIEEVVNALRLCEIENVYTPAIIHKTSKWAFGHDRSFPGRFQPEISYSREVDENWLKSFVAFWKIVQSPRVKDRKFLNVAIRRFGYAHERHRTDDKIVDLLIAAEALFFNDFKEGSYIGEIKYRLSLRAALFLASDTEIQRTIFRWMKAAYDVRSNVAHGRKWKSKHLPKYADGTTATHEQFVWQIQEYLRLAIVKAIHLASEANSSEALVDWDELVFQSAAQLPNKD
jgi:hypothetical protein